jgi:hypothetical protein
MSKLTFLHITDCHLSKTATVDVVDIKTKASGIVQPLRSEVIRHTLNELTNSLNGRRIKLDAVLFSGDGTFKGDPGGQVELRKMLLTELAPLGVTNDNLVATPGNHDIVAGTEPNSPERYELFKAAWVNPGLIRVPFLDGIHKIENLDVSAHVLKDPAGAWAVFPINTANWSQLRISDKDNKEVALLRKHIGGSAPAELTNALETLCRYDVARVSEGQLRALKELVKRVGDVRLRVAVLHHHLLPVDSREEFKPFADITNLGHLRQVLRELGFHVIVHGHKHATAAHYDHVYPDNASSAAAHRMLTISGGTFGPTGQHPDTPMRLIEIDGLPHAPTCIVRTISSAAAGRNLTFADSPSYCLWESDPAASGPSFVCGSSIDDVYTRAIQIVKDNPDRPIICTIDFASIAAVPFPSTYPYGGDDEERCQWFQETVMWWQLPASRIEVRIPYIHGSRLKRYGGNLNQINRVVDLLRNEKITSKAIALVVDPGRDFGPNTPFASFCFVQFCLRPSGRLDCIGYYRAQEFNYWWPVNVAELRHLQLEVAGKADVQPGKITTFSPYPRLSESIRQPTKVAVPLIDQWVDNHPGRIAQIALALTNGAGGSHTEGLLYWNRCLEDLTRGATSYHADGVPVAIEGLTLLRDWLLAANAPPQIVSLIEQLLDANLAHQESPSREAFDRWKTRVTSLLSSLRNFPARMPTAGISPSENT